MQLLGIRKKSACGVCLEGVRRPVRVASEKTTITSTDIPGDTKTIRLIMKNDNGLMIVKGEEGVFYIRHDIIFAKAGDVFFMPRKVPANFKIEEETIIPKSELEQFEVMSGKF